MKHDYETGELIREMDLLKNTFDMVRLIDILQQKQCTFSLNQSEIRCDEFKCDFMCQEEYHTYKSVLLKVLDSKTTYTRFQYFEDNMYCIVAKYIRVEGNELILELIMKRNMSKIPDRNPYDLSDEPKESCGCKKIKLDRGTLRKRKRTKESVPGFEELSYGIDHDEFYLLYQPKIENLSGRVIGLEALIRWKKMGNGLNSAESFIISFEKNNLIYLIDYYVFRKVFEQMREWKRQGKEIIPISINMCCSTLLRKDFFVQIEKIMAGDAFVSQIEIEFTERNIPLDRVRELSAAAEKLKKLGFQIALDDFGAYSANFPLVFEMNLNTLKIDKSLIADIIVNTKIQQILKDIFSACRAFGIRVIVEGVEEKEQLDLLTSIGSEFSQGYYFSKPVDLLSIKKRY